MKKQPLTSGAYLRKPSDVAIIIWFIFGLTEMKTSYSAGIYIKLLMDFGGSSGICRDSMKPEGNDEESQVSCVFINDISVTILIES